MPPHIPLPEDPSYDYPPIYAKVFLVDSFLQFEKPCMQLSTPINAPTANTSAMQSTLPTRWDNPNFSNYNTGKHAGF